MLQALEIEPFVAAVIALAGVLVGLGIARFVLPGTRKIKRLQTEIEQLRREHGEYRERVSSHFHKTGELIGQMTASYKAVYDHLSDGAQTLCAGDALAGPAFSGPRLIVADNVDVTPEGVSPAGPASATGAASAPSTAAPTAAGSSAQAAGPTGSAGGADEGVCGTEAPAEDRSVRKDAPSAADGAA